VLVCALLLATAPAAADTLICIHAGSGSGTLNGTPFPLSNFTITATMDTANRLDFGGVWSIDHSSAFVSIDGVGGFDILTPTRTFVNNGVQIVGFSRAGDIGSDLFDGPNHSEFASWDMLDPIGPLSGAGWLGQWGFEPQINTSGGILFFNDATPEATFTAIPEPSSASFLAVMASVLAARRRT
jgi:hypothetical protein